jgi:hypothetical protein
MYGGAGPNANLGVGKSTQTSESIKHNNSNLSPQEKEVMLQNLKNTVEKSLGYEVTKNDVKLVSTDKTGANGEEFKGHYNSDGEGNGDKNTYINDKNNDSTSDLVATIGHETQHSMDEQKGIYIQNDKDQNKYASNFGENLSFYTSQALDQTDEGSLASTNSHNSGQITSVPSVFNDNTIKNNNANFANVDTSKGDDRKVYLYDRTFAPADKFGESLGSIYHGDGDDRKFSVDKDASSRVTYNTFLDTQTGESKTNVFSDETIKYDAKTKEIKDRQTANPSSSTSFKDGQLTYEVDASNPLPPVFSDLPKGIKDTITPSIDMYGDYKFTDIEDGKLIVEGKGTGNQFPSREVFIKDENNQDGIFLGTSSIQEGVDPKDGFDVAKNLFGDKEDQTVIAPVKVEVEYDSKGSIINVKDLNTNKTYTTEEWNKQFIEKSTMEGK